MKADSLVLISIILLLVSCAQSYEANKFIHRHNEENSHRHWVQRLQESPFIILILVTIMLVIAYIMMITA